MCSNQLTVDEKCFVDVASPAVMVRARPPPREKDACVVTSLMGFVQMFVTGEEVRSGAEPCASRWRLPEVEGRLPPLKDIDISSWELYGPPGVSGGLKIL